MKTLSLAFLLALAATVPAAENELTPKEKAEGWRTLFAGKNLNGWHVSAKTGHSGASKHQSGGRWVVEQGAMVG